MLLSYFNTQSFQLNQRILLIKVTALPEAGGATHVAVSTKIALNSVFHSSRDGSGATVPLTSTATGTRPFLAPLPGPRGPGPSPAHHTMGRQNERNHWPSTDSPAGQEPEMEPEGTWEGEGAGGEDGNPQRKREETGGDGWLVGVRMCAKGTVCVGVCLCGRQYCTVEINVLFLCKTRRARTQSLSLSGSRMFFLVFK